MTANLVSPEEQERLKDLHSLNLLDSQADERFDTITRLAAKVFHAPMATISLVDANRQWFKSRVGLDMCQTDRNISFCSYAILQDDALIIEDTLLDKRFANNPLVLQPPHIRFYAGYPLRGPKGHRIATLCILDHQPRKFTSDDTELLRELARMAEKALQVIDLVDLQKHLLEVQDQLLQSRDRMAKEVREAASFVTSLLPQPLTGAIQTKHIYEPSSELGGDCFYYQWVNEDVFAVYGVDVAGHGISAALLTVSILNSLNALVKLQFGTITASSALGVLNKAFPMEKQGNRFSTAWIAFYNRKTRTLEYAGAAHPSPLHLRWSETGKPTLTPLNTSGLPLGIMPDVKYVSQTVQIAPGDRILLFSDGVYEAEDRSHTHGTYEDFCFLIYSMAENHRNLFDKLLECRISKKDELHFEDDVTLVELEFGE